MGGRPNDNADAMIGDETCSLAGKESFSKEGFNDGGGDLEITGKQTVEHSGKMNDPLFNDGPGVLDGGHISG